MKVSSNAERVGDSCFSIVRKVKQKIDINYPFCESALNEINSTFELAESMAKQIPVVLKNPDMVTAANVIHMETSINHIKQRLCKKYMS